MCTGKGRMTRAFAVRNNLLSKICDAYGLRATRIVENLYKLTSLCADLNLISVIGLFLPTLLIFVAFPSLALKHSQQP